MDAKYARNLLIHQAETWMNENYQLEERVRQAIKDIRTMAQLKIDPKNWEEHSYKIACCANLLGYKTRHFADKFIINVDF